ncbi:sensor histidine kinase [Wenzhouxiangella marina]|nr:ATP-binding protein [Wenzhouxiangella marina]MBB6087180.1 signal transduction histidine kinase [Wenzhouxiangella marina]
MLQARADSPAFRLLGVEQGLPDSQVESLVRDRDGFVWIATRAGLVRHEGQQLRQVRVGDRAGTLPGSNIMALAPSSRGGVWAAVSGQGVVRVGSDLHVQEHLAPRSEGGPLPEAEVWSIAEDCQGQLWLAFMRGGVGRYEPTSGAFRLYEQTAEHGLSEGGFQMAVTVDRGCRIWLVQSDQVSVLGRPGEPRFELVSRRQADQALFTDLIELAPAELVVVQGQTLHRVRVAPSGWRLEPWFETDGVIVDAVRHGDGWLSLSTYEGLVRWHPEGGQRRVIRQHDAVLDGLPSNHLQKLLLDHEGGLWVAVARRGLAYLPASASAVTRYQRRPGQAQGLAMQSVHAVLPDPDPDLVWLAGRTEGIQRLDLASGRAQSAADVFGAPVLDGLDRISDLDWAGEQLVIGWSSRVQLFDPAVGRLRTLFERARVEDGTVSFVTTDGASEVWVASHDRGLRRFDLARNMETHFHSEASPAHAIPNDAIGAMARDATGAWWMAAGRQVFRYRDGEGFQPVLGLAQGPIRALAWQGETLWLSSDRELSAWRSSARGFHPVAQHDLGPLIPGGRPLSLLVDSDQAVWLVLSSGLLHLDLSEGPLRYLGRGDGVAVGELMPQAASLLPDGRLLVGGGQGLALIDRLQLGKAQRALAPVLLGVNGAGQRLPLPLREPLEYWQRDVRLEFASPSYLAPERVRYRLRLDGWQEDWLELRGQGQQVYTNLSPGAYRLQVQAALPGGAWSDSGAEIDFRVAPPPWQQAPALSAYGALVLGLGFLGLRVHRRSRARNRALREARQRRRMAEQANAAKSEFVAVMSHEIRTPMHGIFGMVELLRESSPDPRQDELLATLQRSGQQLQRVIDDVLDLSRVEAGRFELVERPFELMASLEASVELFAPMAAGKDLELRLCVASDLPLIANGDPDRFAQVLGNLLSNAIKFTPAGAVELSARSDRPGRLRLTVSDQGPGIRADDAQRLFEPFERLDRGARPRGDGSGLGLAITRRLVDAMGGTIRLADKPAAGARFQVDWPELLDPASVPRPSPVLAELSLTTWLDPALARCVWRLARRWGFCCSRYRASRMNGRIALIDPSRRPLSRALEADLEAFDEVLVLRRPGSCPRLPVPASPLPWPLTERQLISALSACVWTGRHVEAASRSSD